MKSRTMRLQQLKIFLALGVLVILVGAPFVAPAAASPNGNTYYVATDGSDAAVGDLDHPWKTFKRATDAAVAGDTVYIRGGVYYERLLPLRSGTEGNWIRYLAYPSEEVTLDGTTVPVPAYYGLVDMNFIHYIQVSGLRVINAGFYGIVAKNSSFITFDHNYTYGSYSSGIASWNNQNVIIDHNEVVAACASGLEENLTVSNTDTFTISNNSVHDVLPGTNGQIGIAVKDSAVHGKIFGNLVYNLKPVGIYINAYASHLYDMDMYSNVAYNIEEDGMGLASEAGGLLENIRVFNNISYNNLTGFWLSSCCKTSHPFKDIYIYNNTFAYNGNAVWGIGLGVDNAEIQNLVIRNNIVSQNVYAQISALPAAVPNIIASNNLTDGHRNPLKELYGVGDLINVSPQFVNPAGRDLHLSLSSPAIDAGYALGAPAFDFDGDLRPLDGNANGSPAFDIGADEFSLPASRVYLPLLRR